LAICLVVLGCNVMEPELLPEHACEHVSVAGTAIDAAASPEDDGSALLEATAEPYTVTLVDGAPGFVRIEVTESTGAVLFVGAEAVVQGLTYCDCAVPLADPAPNGYCAELIPEHYHLELWPGVFHLELGPATADAETVWLMLAPLAEAATHTHED
jgi:hypothetical protein